MIFTIPSQSRNADQWQKLCQLKKKNKKTKYKTKYFFLLMYRCYLSLNFFSGIFSPHLTTLLAAPPRSNSNSTGFLLGYYQYLH